MRLIPMPWSTVHAFRSPESNGTFVPRTGWMSTRDIRVIRWLYETRAMQPDFRSKFAFQVADSETDSLTTVTLGTTQTVEGFNRGALTDITSNIGSKQLIRFGYMTWNAQTDNVLVAAAMGGFVEYTSCT